MRITNAFENQFLVQKDVKNQEQLGLLLSNKKGGYLWLEQDPLSRYQGWFFSPRHLLGKKVIRVLESITVSGAAPVEELRNNFGSFDRKRSGLTESFFLPPDRDCLVYETDRPVTCDVFFDVTECNDHRDWDRHYQVYREGGTTIVEYDQPGLPCDKVFIALIFDGGDNGLPQDWVKRDYGYDHSRNSPPYERYVFRALNLSVKKIVMAVSVKKEEAKDNASYVYKNCEALKRKLKGENQELFSSLLKRGSPLSGRMKNKDYAASAFCALHSLDSFCVSVGEFFAMYAGLPWFYQFWNRDEAICLPMLARYRKDPAQKIVERRLLELEMADYKTGTADESGWFFLACARLLASKLLPLPLAARITVALQRTIERDLKEKTLDGFAQSMPKETWMDSLERPGARIEIQALRLMMYCLAKDLAQSPRQKERYAALESALARAVRSRFLNGALLADGFDVNTAQADWTARPNIFLAAYVYPGLMDREEWAKCFKYALAKLWLDWGGLATVDKNLPEFQARHTGENPASYHNGDSWFYLNNIAAVAMARADAKRFDYNIKKIIASGTYDMLWTGISGYAAELSPASNLDSAGSPAQAWTSATFLELLLEAG